MHSLIENYQVIQNSWSSTEYYSVLINLYNKDGHIKGELRFHKEEHSPVDSFDRNNDKIILHFPLHRYLDVIDLLRNEKPITLGFNTFTNEGWIRSGQEPVGEEET